MENSNWNDWYYDESEKSKWQEVFGDDANTALEFKDVLPDVSPEVAFKYHQNNLSPWDAAEWRHHNVEGPEEISSWKKLEINPEIASEFKSNGLDPQTYEKYRDFGITELDDITKLMDDNSIAGAENLAKLKVLIDDGTIKMEEIRSWLSAKITPEEIKKWVEVGINDPTTIFQWKELELSPKMAHNWLTAVQSPQEAYRWLQAGYKNPSDVKAFISRGFDSPEDLDSQLDDLRVKF
jgi:hypothetical protein